MKPPKKEVPKENRFLGALIGGVLGLIGSNKTNKANRQLANDTNVFNAEEARKARAFSQREAHTARKYDAGQAVLAHRRNVAQIKEARRFDREQVKEARRWSKRESMLAEKRGRKYLQEDRQYADPAAQRARLEAAGFNPLTGIDASSTLQGSGAVVPGGPSAAQSSIAQAAAASAGIPGTVAASGVTATMQAPDFSFIGDAFTAYADAQQREKEYALRKSQIDMENARLSQLMQAATVKPVVGGIYERQQEAALAETTRPQMAVPSQPERDQNYRSDPLGGASRDLNGDFAPSVQSVDAAGRAVPERLQEQLTMDVYNPVTGQWYSMPNPDVVESGLFETADGLAVHAVAQTEDRWGWLKNTARGLQMINQTGIFGLPEVQNSDNRKARRPVRKPTRPVDGYNPTGYDIWVPQRNVQ